MLLKWLKQIRHQSWFEIIIAAVSVIFGLIIQPILQKYTDPLFSLETKAILVGILVLGFMLVGGITAIGVYLHRVENITPKQKSHFTR